MIRINIHEAKTHLSRFLKRLRAGEVILICKRNVPIAELRAVAGHRTAKRPIGLEQGKLTVPSSFFEPLPDDILDAFGGAQR